MDTGDQTRHYFPPGSGTPSPLPTSCVCVFVRLVSLCVGLRVTVRGGVYLLGDVFDAVPVEEQLNDAGGDTGGHLLEDVSGQVQLDQVSQVLQRVSPQAAVTQLQKGEDTSSTQGFGEAGVGPDGSYMGVLFPALCLYLVFLSPMCVNVC